MMSSTSTVLLYQNIHSNFHVPIEPCCSRDSAGAANFLSCRISTGCKIRAQNPLALNMDKSLDNPGVIAFPPLIWLVNAVISVLVHLFIRLPIMRYSVPRLRDRLDLLGADAGAVGPENNESGRNQRSPCQTCAGDCARRAVSLHT